jgi:hypothetical protein
MKQYYFFLLFVFCFFGSHAQKRSGVKYSSINQFGALKGNSDQEIQVQTINGIKYKTWFAGAGIGLDYYYYRTVPLFIDFRKYIFGKKECPFFYADLGTNLPWIKKEANDGLKHEFTAGWFYEAGIGYTVPIKERFFFNFSAGYSQKNLHEARSYPDVVIWDFPPYGGPGKQYYDYCFRRISLKAALQF